MSYIDEIFRRTDLQHIREFLLHGVEAMDVTEKSYKERIDESQKHTLDYIRKKYPDEDEFEMITDKIMDLISITQEVYLEIGMRCGARLSGQILDLLN